MNKKGFVLEIFLLVLLGTFLVLIIRDNQNLAFIDSDENIGLETGEKSHIQNPGTETDTNSSPEKNTDTTPENPAENFIPQKTSLTSEEVSKVREAILSSEFIGDLPNEGIISLQFFNIENGQKVWLNTFLIGKNQILTSGTPEIFITLHYKYIAELTPTNLCEIIPRANANGDLGVWSDLSDTKLALKYSGVIKYRDCFGI